MNDIHPSILRCLKGRVTAASSTRSLTRYDYPTPEEAWDAYPKSAEGEETAFLCDEMISCGEPAMVIYRSGDEILARDVFIRLFTLEMQAPATKTGCKWFLSVGESPELRQRYLREALSLQLISRQHFNRLGGVDSDNLGQNDHSEDIPSPGN